MAFRRGEPRVCHRQGADAAGGRMRGTPRSPLDAWNSRDPNRVSLAYTEDSRWRNRSEFITDHVRYPLWFFVSCYRHHDNAIPRCPCAVASDWIGSRGRVPSVRSAPLSNGACGSSQCADVTRRHKRPPMCVPDGLVRDLRQARCVSEHLFARQLAGGQHGRARSISHRRTSPILAPEDSLTATSAPRTHMPKLGRVSA
jgi:hypothetical protein